MPSNLLNADIAFPQGGSDKSVVQQLGEVRDYLFMLLEQLRYALGNLDIGNFNDAGLEELAKVITKPVYIALEDEEERRAQVEITADKINWLVSDGTSASNFQITSRLADLTATHIDLTGYVTFHSLANPNTTTVIDGGELIACDIYATEGGDKAHMSAAGLELIMSDGEKKVRIGIEKGQLRDQPYILLGTGSSTQDITDAGLIEKFKNGIWIGSSQAMGADQNEPPASSGVTGIWVDFSDNTVYKFENGVKSSLGSGGTSTAVFG